MQTNADNMTATYSPEDNKLRLRSPYRLDAETYATARKLGFIYAPEQGLFVAPKWSPEREDFLTELCGEIGDEDTSLVDRTAERADRFTDYSAKRAQDAHRAREGVQAITEGIPLGQPILVGHHSEKHARRDAERIENGMRKAVKMWETSQYWKSRAAGAISAAKYKERPDVRARRIKTLEAEERGHQRPTKKAELFLKLWEAPGLDMRRALQIASRDYGFWSDLNSGKISAEQARDNATANHRRSIEHAARHLAHLAHRLEYERAMLEESGYAPPPKPKTAAALPLLNYHGPISYRNPYHRGEFIKGEAHHMTKAEFARINADYKGTRVSECGTHRVRTAMLGGSRIVAVFLTDSKQHTRPDAVRVAAKVEEESAAATIRLEAATRQLVARTTAREAAQTRNAAEKAQNEKFAAMRGQLRQGVLPVSVPQLFPTPPALAARMVELADIKPGQRVLEPSAGTGNILKAIPASARKVAVELNGNLANGLLWIGAGGEFGLDIRHTDFMQAENLGTFDRVVMNPPFAQAQDIDHIKRALSLLKPGGRLVAICANGPRQNAALRPLVEAQGGIWETLPTDTFAGTGVRAVLLALSA